MSRNSVIVLITCLLLAGTALGFDGQRKGFVLGGGLGFAPVAHWEVDANLFGLQGSAEEDKFGVALQFVIGGAFDEHNMLVYEGNVAGFKSDFGDEGIAQGFNGAAWYHYFGPVGKSFYTTVGLGFYYFKIGDYDATDPGGALLLGGGYEFSPHWQIGVSLTVGSTSESIPLASADLKHANLSVMVSGIAF